MVVINPLEKFDRNDLCWCGSTRKYKICHGNVRPRSLVGEPVPPDDDDGYWLSPTTKIDRGVIARSLSGKTVPISIPAGKPEARPYPYPDVIKGLVAEPPDTLSASIGELGRLRFASYANVGVESDWQIEDMSDNELDGIRSCAINYAFSVSRAMIKAKVSENPPTVIFNRDTETAALLGHTLLWASHITVPDRLFDAVTRNSSPEYIKEALREHFRLRPLIEIGAIVPIPEDLASVLIERKTLQVTAADLRDQKMVNWVRSQMLMEGPTGRETLFFSAADDLDEWPVMKTLARQVSVNEEDRSFVSKMLGHYRPDHDYQPWIDQSVDEAISKYVRDINESVSVSGFFGGSYVTRSPFHARLLAMKGYRGGPAQAALWSPAPVLRDVDPEILAKAALEEGAVADLRKRMNRAVRACNSQHDEALKIADLVEELEEESIRLKEKLRRSRLWSSMTLGFGLGTVALGASSFGIGLLALGAANMAKDILPLLEKYDENKNGASWLYYTTERRQRRANRRRP